MKATITALFVSVLSMLSFGSARAEVIISITQVGNNVVATGSGTLNITALTQTSELYAYPDVLPSYGEVLLGAPTYLYGLEYSGISGPTSLGPGVSYTLPDSGSGSLMGVSNGVLVVPDPYVSGSPLSVSDQWNNTTISGLGLADGTYSWTWGTGVNADSLTVNVSSVPEPTSLMMTAGALSVLVLAAVARRSKGRASA